MKKLKKNKEVDKENIDVEVIDIDDLKDIVGGTIDHACCIAPAVFDVGRNKAES
jgi:hypothetical protein